MTTDNKTQMEQFIRAKSIYIATDKDGNYVFLAETPFLLTMAQSDYPEIEFHFTSDFKVGQEV